MSNQPALIGPMQVSAPIDETTDKAGKPLSPWMDGRVPPVQVGPYQRRRKSDGKSLGYSMWSGSAWMYGAISPGDAAVIDSMVSDYQLGAEVQWRGVALPGVVH